MVVHPHLAKSIYTETSLSQTLYNKLPHRDLRPRKSRLNPPSCILPPAFVSFVSLYQNKHDECNAEK